MEPLAEIRPGRPKSPRLDWERYHPANRRLPARLLFRPETKRRRLHRRRIASRSVSASANRKRHATTVPSVSISRNAAIYAQVDLRIYPSAWVLWAPTVSWQWMRAAFFLECRRVPVPFAELAASISSSATPASRLSTIERCPDR